MNKFEEIMLKISRFFGLIVMSLTLLIILLIVLGYIIDFGSGIFEKSTPDVKFYKSDFVETTEKADKRPVDSSKAKIASLARKATNDLLSDYEGVVDSYVSQERDKLFAYAENKEEKEKEFKENKIATFKKNTRIYLRARLANYREKFQEPYIDGLVAYIKESEGEGVPVLTQRGVPVNTIAYSRVVGKYNQEFNSQMWQLMEKDKDSGMDIADYIALGSLFFLITIFLIISMMFAIIKIEEKMK